MRNRQSWRGFAAALIVALTLASTPAAAQASTVSPAGPSWIEWVMTQASVLWQVVAGGGDNTGQLPDPKP